jgi:hypothetical protein
MKMVDFHQHFKPTSESLQYLILSIISISAGGSVAVGVVNHDDKGMVTC